MTSTGNRKSPSRAVRALTRVAPAWSRTHVSASLLLAGLGWRDRAWISGYLLNRRGPRVLRRMLEKRFREKATLRLRGLAAPLQLSVETGGLATYYEIVTQRIYAPNAGFIPARGQTVVDVGANVGVFSLWAASRIGPGGRLFAVEPHPASYSYLERNLHPFAPAADVMQVACGMRSGELDLHYVPGRLSVSSMHPRPDRTGLVRVPVARLDDLLARAGIDGIDLLKIDVEGAEREVFAGAQETLTRVARLVIEVDVDGAPWVEQMLSGIGFRLVERRTGMWDLPSSNVTAFER